MAWAVPENSRTKIDAAGRALFDDSISSAERAGALLVVNNWRSAHAFPLNTFQSNLRRVTVSLDADPTVAQRIKRLPSIVHKLERFPAMNLARMQDLGGCRAVLSDVSAAEALVEYYLSKSNMKHRLVRQDRYTETPKASGYRGTHLVYSYYSDYRSDWNGLKVEIQVRSRLQHAWATAVETVGTFTKQALKSSWGEKRWLRFFALMSSAIAVREGTALVPGTPRDVTMLRAEIRELAAELEVISRLRAYGSALQLVDATGGRVAGHTFLLVLDIRRQQLRAQRFRNVQDASAAYAEVEEEVAGNQTKDAVLVTVESLDSLRRAFPNYFLDTTAFLASVEEAIA